MRLCQQQTIKRRCTFYFHGSSPVQVSPPLSFPSLALLLLVRRAFHRCSRQKNHREHEVMSTTHNKKTIHILFSCNNYSKIIIAITATIVTANNSNSNNCSSKQLQQQTIVVSTIAASNNCNIKQ